MGALAFRTSFTQNVLRHSVEVALLMGTMAAEMGLDAVRARRIGFLHDIGKAMTAEKKGAHALLGAEFLKSHGEDASVSVELHIIVDRDVNIPVICKSMMSEIRYRIREATGIELKTIDIFVDSIQIG